MVNMKICCNVSEILQLKLNDFCENFFLPAEGPKFHHIQIVLPCCW